MVALGASGQRLCNMEGDDEMKLTPEALERAHQYGAWHKERVAVFQSLDNANLAATARLYMAHMSPLPFAPGEPVYDATMWHVILPELIRRIGSK